ELGVDERLDRAVEAELLEVHARRLGALVVDGHCLGHCFGDVPAHAGLEGALAGEHEGDLGHAVAPVVSCVHLISAEPPVRPAPMPVSSTSLPGSSRPSSSASARASGIDPEEVLPYLSTLTTVFSCGTCSF